MSWFQAPGTVHAGLLAWFTGTLNKTQPSLTKFLTVVLFLLWQVEIHITGPVARYNCCALKYYGCLAFLLSLTKKVIYSCFIKPRCDIMWDNGTSEWLDIKSVIILRLWTLCPRPHAQWSEAFLHLMDFTCSSRRFIWNAACTVVGSGSSPTHLSTYRCAKVLLLNLYYFHRESVIYLNSPQPLTVAFNRLLHTLMMVWLQGREGQHWLASLPQKTKGHGGFLSYRPSPFSPLWYLSLIIAALCSPVFTNPSQHSSMCGTKPCNKCEIENYYYLWIMLCWSEGFLETTESIFKYIKSLQW